MRILIRAASVLLAALCAAAPGLGGNVAPVIDYPPTPQAGIHGAAAFFTVIASGSGPLAYQWRKDGVDLEDGPGVAGRRATTCS
jgi:hypothetical protein